MPKTIIGKLTCLQRKGVDFYEFKSEGLHEKLPGAAWNFGNRLSLCLMTEGNQEKLFRSGWSQDLPNAYCR